jgi:hypothetical protein
MRPRNPALSSPLAEPIRLFIKYKRALNRRFCNEERALSLLDRHLVEHGVLNPIDVTPTVVETFLASRHRLRPGSYNHLLGVVRRLFVCRMPTVSSKWPPRCRTAGGRRNEVQLTRRFSHCYLDSAYAAARLPGSPERTSISAADCWSSARRSSVSLGLSPSVRRWRPG